MEICMHVGETYNNIVYTVQGNKQIYAASWDEAFFIKGEKSLSAGFLEELKDRFSKIIATHRQPTLKFDNICH